jgi:hypothetical protein
MFKTFPKHNFATLWHFNSNYMHTLGLNLRIQHILHDIMTHLNYEYAGAGRSGVYFSHMLQLFCPSETVSASHCLRDALTGSPGYGLPCDLACVVQPSSWCMAAHTVYFSLADLRTSCFPALGFGTPLTPGAPPTTTSNQIEPHIPAIGNNDCQWRQILIGQRVLESRKRKLSAG